MPAVSSTLAVASLAASLSVNTTFSPVHYAPAATKFSNLTWVINGTGTDGQIYSSSKTPKEQYGTYNWCNMPHVRKAEYTTPSAEYELEYVEVIHRHHKRTPYASNTFFEEDIKWDCSDSLVAHYAAGEDVAQITWDSFTDEANPMTKTVGPGFIGTNCQFPQITDQGLEDSHQHGLDLAGVYRDKLGFLPKKLDAKKVSFRVTNNVITSQVLGSLVTGMFPSTEKKGYETLIQSDSYDSLEPTYSCAAADAIRSAYEGTNANWTEHLSAAASLYDKLDAVSGIEKEDDAGWHTSFDHYFDNLSAKLCHGKSLPCSTNSTSTCVTQKDADEVFRLGQLEYIYRWRGAENSTAYSTLKYAAWMMELRSHLKAKISGTSQKLYSHNIAHDGSMSPLLGFLQVSEMVWPGMGSEIVFELYKKKKAGAEWFLRVLWGGQPIKTSTPLGTLDMVKIEHFFAYLDQQLPSDLRAACSA